MVVDQLNTMMQLDLQIVLLGTGYADFENAFAWFGHAYPDKMSANITLI